MKYWVEIEGYDSCGKNIVEKIAVDDYDEMIHASRQMKQASLKELPYWEYSEKKGKPIRAGTFYPLAAD